MDSLCFPWRRIPPPVFPSAFQAGRNRARTNTGAERAGARRCFTLEHLKLCILPVSVCVCVCGLLLLWRLEVRGSNLGIGMFMFATSVNVNIRSAAPALLEQQPRLLSEGRSSAQPSFTRSAV